MPPTHPEQAVIQLALQRGYLNQGQVQAALQAQAQYQQRGQPTALLPLLRGALQPAHVQELSEVYRKASEAFDVAASAATIQLPPGAVNQALAHSHASYAPSPGAAPAVHPSQGAADPYASAARQRALVAASSQPAPSPAAQADAPPPATLGRFEIQREIARGGMGVVYVARDPNLDRQVAIKCLLPGGDVHPEQVERFRREGLAVARLKHPNIVQVYEVAEHQGAWYMVMDLVTGGSLMDKLKTEGQLSPEDAARIVRDLARATACAHEHNVLHRDIKPHNVLIAANGTPKLTDFGLAKLEDVPVAESQPAAQQDHTAFQAVEVGMLGGASLTRGGQILGTPGYLPPEQAEGAKARIDTRSDIYSLGATLFALLAGRPPFVGDTILQVLQQLLNQPAPSVGSLRKGVDRRLEQIIARCLERAPDDRYPTAVALADDLEAWLGRHATLQSTSKRRAGPNASSRRRASPRAGASARNLKAAASGRHPRSSAGSNAPLVVGAIALATTGLALYLLLGRSPPPPPGETPSASETPVAQVTEPAFQNTPRYNDPPPPDDEPPLDDEPPVDEEPPADEPPVEDAPPQDDAPPLDDLPPIDEPPPARPPQDDGPAGDVASLLAEAGQLIQDGREREALEKLDRAIELVPEDPQVYLRRAQLNGRLAEYFDAFSDASQALELRPEWPQALLMRGKASLELGRLDDARRDLERVIELAPRKRVAKRAQETLAGMPTAPPPGQPAPRDPAPRRGDRNRAGQLCNEAGEAAQAGRSDEALAKIQAAVEADPDFHFALAVRGQLRARFKGDIQGGLADTTRAIELGPGFPIGYVCRAEVRQHGGDTAGALADLRQARPLAEKLRPDMVPQIDGYIAQLEGR